MKRFVISAALAMALFVPAAFAQNSGEIGAFADYVRLGHANNANFWGFGGRASFNVHTNVAIEGEVSYDFQRAFTRNLADGGTITTVRSGLTLLHGLFGPKVQTGGGPVRAFVTAKGGFLNFRATGTRPTVGQGFVDQVGGVLDGDTNGVFYPGGGLEAFFGPIGFRLDVGDLIYFDDGANHNLRVTFGPHIRF
ncbi:MAG TPA: hypothetical protein VD837_08640 [Terriglobales bacterium]|nr:hypothetical protein [Terriglobales bacterium]